MVAPLEGRGEERRARCQSAGGHVLLRMGHRDRCRVGLGSIRHNGTVKARRAASPRCRPFAWTPPIIATRPFRAWPLAPTSTNTAKRPLQPPPPRARCACACLRLWQRGSGACAHHH
eukprot:scaffold8001_cov125-Isochrysis_galbana.AAC.1